MFRSLLSITILLFLSTSTLYAQSTKELLNEALQDYQLQDFSMAESKFRFITNEDPENIYAHYLLGITLIQIGKFTEAIKHLEYAANTSDPIEGIDQALAQAYQGANLFAKALPLNKKLYDSKPKNDAYAFQYAVSLQKTGSHELAITIYKKIILNGGDYVDAARYQMAKTFYNAGAYTSAIKQFKAVKPDSNYGEASSAYLDALQPMNRPIRAYISAAYFYNDNVNSGGAQRLGATSSRTAVGSQGTTLIGTLNSRQFELNDKFNWKLGYLYYGILHSQKGTARENDFIGHFIKPEINFHPTLKMNFNLKGEVQFLNFGHQKMSNNYGATLTATRHMEARQNFANIHIGYLKKAYTNNFVSSGVVSSLQYLDANSWSVGAGGSYSAKGWPVRLTLDYNFTNEKTIRSSNKAKDSEFIEHTIKAEAALPLSGLLSKATLLGNIDYAKKKYTNAQVELYQDVLGQKVNVNLLTWGIKAQVSTWERLGLITTVGYEQIRSTSNTLSFKYNSKKYYGQLSATY